MTFLYSTSLSTAAYRNLSLYHKRISDFLSILSPTFYVLYRQTMEEEDGSYEEIVCTLTNDYIVEQLIISGGMVIPAIKQQLVFKLEEFPDRLLRKSKDLFLETVELLEKKLK